MAEFVGSIGNTATGWKHEFPVTGRLRDSAAHVAQSLTDNALLSRKDGQVLFNELLRDGSASSGVYHGTVAKL